MRALRQDLGSCGQFLGGNDRRMVCNVKVRQLSDNFLPRILLVDDDQANLKALEAALGSLRVDFVAARTGLEAFRHAASGDFALCLLDVHLPAVDGYETAQLLRSLERSEHIPIIFLTESYDSPEFVARGYALGAVDYMVKPLDPHVLRSKVKVFVELHRKYIVMQQQAEQLRQVSERKLEDYRRKSEERYAALADAMPLIMWTSDPRGAITYRNARWLECAGDNVATDWSAIVHPDHLDTFLAAWDNALRSEQSWEAEFRFCDATREHTAWQLVRAVPKRGVNGEVTSWVGTITDIDVQKRARQALEMLTSFSQRLTEVREGDQSMERALLSALPLLGDAVLLHVTGDEQFQERCVSAALPQFPIHKLEDPRFHLITTAIQSGEPAIYTLESLERSSPQSGTVPHFALLRELEATACISLPLMARYRALGSITFFSANSSRSYAAEDLTLAQDVAHRLATALDNLRLDEIASHERAESDAASHAKNVFLATLSHELRTPLNAIVGWIHILKTGDLGNAKREHVVETIDRNARTLARLVGDLLDVSRIISGNFQLQHVRVDIRSIVETAWDASRPSAYPAGLVLDPFRQAQQTYAQSSEHRGRGQAAANDLVELHQRDITRNFEEAGQGSSFIVKLPLFDNYASLHRPCNSAIPQPPAASDDRSKVTPDQLAGFHALVVEDDPDSRDLVEEILCGFGARVTCVDTAEAAIRALVDCRPDVLVSDIGLPDLDGLTLIRRIRKMQGLEGLPAIALSAYASRQDVRRALAAGFQAHIAKPLDPDQLGTIVANAING